MTVRLSNQLVAELIQPFWAAGRVSQLPLAGTAPQWYPEKAVAIGAYVVAPRPGAPEDRGLDAKDGCDAGRDLLAGQARRRTWPRRHIRRHIGSKRQALGLPSPSPTATQTARPVQDLPGVVCWRR